MRNNIFFYRQDIPNGILIIIIDENNPIQFDPLEMSGW
ncbi:hypothetical protein NU08_3867 [Flavobacterium anhuiense]|uniref:Uncharacterized protein n=1 Tax=Flavobacterium anhuiense TaxID=459526 RepID=A0A444VUJ7_9FLAO|nr:hypothetical protein NU08_3867 [Flavobacterium anhuiense]